MEQVSDTAFLNEREQYWIDALEAYNHQKGYNISRIVNQSTAQSGLSIRYSVSLPPKILEALRVRAADGGNFSGTVSECLARYFEALERWWGRGDETERPAFEEVLA